VIFDLFLDWLMLVLQTGGRCLLALADDDRR